MGCFNPRPTRRQAETLRDAPGGTGGGFNPRPTRRQAETHEPAQLPGLLRSFNPRPTRRQAETPACAPRRRSAPVSIHGPPEGRPKHVRGDLMTTLHLVSIHGPPEGRPKRHLSRPVGVRCGFNPRPTRRQAETPANSTCSYVPSWFQSTAHPKAGRNDGHRPGPGRPGGFNPRPTRRQAETGGAHSAPQCSTCFNPRPTRRQAETPGCCGWTNPRSCFNPRPTRRQAETGCRPR